MLLIDQLQEQRDELASQLFLLKEQYYKTESLIERKEVLVAMIEIQRDINSLQSQISKNIAVRSKMLTEFAFLLAG